MIVSIDTRSGFCFGVTGAIKAAEEELDRSGSLFCLGDIVHNNREVERLKSKGLKIIKHEEYRQLKDCKVLIRAHGEPPETYRIALKNNIQLIDASCPVVLKLQSNIRKGYNQAIEGKGQIVIFGKPGHAEVNGLVGQTLGDAIIISGIKDLDKIDYSKNIFLYAQTTMNTDAFDAVVVEIKKRCANQASPPLFVPFNTICRQVSGRSPQLKEFAQKNDVVLFVSDAKSSNGMFLFEICKQANPRSYFISSAADLDFSWLEGAEKVGISGATSTPLWVMQEVKDRLEKG